MTAAPFPPADVVAGAVSAALVGPFFQSRVQRASLNGFEFHSVSAGPVGPLYLLYHFDKVVIRRRIGGAPLCVCLILDFSVVFFTFPEGNDGITLDSRCSNMCGG